MSPIAFPDDGGEIRVRMHADVSDFARALDQAAERLWHLGQVTSRLPTGPRQSTRVERRVERRRIDRDLRQAARLRREDAKWRRHGARGQQYTVHHPWPRSTR